MFGWIELAARALAGALIVVAGGVALTHWAVRRGHLTPFSWWSRTVRQLSDPALKPLEGRLLRAGQNPQDASLWLVGVAVVLGLGILAIVQWVARLVFTLGLLRGASPLQLLRVGLGWAIGALMLAILVRVVAGWIGAGPYSRPMRVLAMLTEWLIAPIRTRLTVAGPFDLAPVAAYLLLLLLRMFIGA